MPLLKKQSSVTKKLLQHKLYLARECPDSNFDVSDCDLKEIPAGVFSLCKVLQKEALLLQCNQLVTLKSAGKFADLIGLRILDLHCNMLTFLPDDIGNLHNLQVLNLEHNKLKSLPDTIDALSALQTLNLRDNRLKQFPDCCCRLKSLRILDISSNFINVIPNDLCHVRTLENLILDVNQMTYPSTDICAGGTESVMKFLCSESDVPYCPPSMVLLDVLSSPRLSSSSFTRGRSFSANESTIAETVLQYENLKERRRQEMLALEHQLEEDQRQQALLAAHAASNKEHLLQFVAQEQARLNGELIAAQQQKDLEREKLVETLSEAEKNASELVIKLLRMNEKARKTEELLEQLEKERMEAEQWYTVRQEELQIIRRREVLASMERMIEHKDFLVGTIKNILSNQHDIVNKINILDDENEDRMENILNTKQIQKETLVQELSIKEILQKEAFEVLQCQKDARHKRITAQIVLIEKELMELTMLEMEQRSIKLDIRMNVLEEKRKALTELLLQLMEEKDKRESELHARLLEMEEMRLAHQTDYWLVQYQRLLDSKPISLIDQERHLEYQVIDIINSSEASEYLPQFVLHRVTIETLLQMTDNDLVQIGINELGLRRMLLKNIESFKQNRKFQDGKAKKVSDHLALPAMASRQLFSRQRIGSAPPITDHDFDTENSEIIAHGIHSRCTICLDAQSDILFLNCGHICTCHGCAEPLVECPLDRSVIVRKIRLVVDPLDSDDACADP